MSNPSKESMLTLDQQVIAGVDKYFSAVPKLTLGGKDYTPVNLKAVYQADIDAQKASDQARAKATEAVANRRDARATTRAISKLLRGYLLNTYGAQAAAMLDDFGFVAPKKPAVKVQVKADAQVKSKATRKARGTMGKKQRRSIKAQPAATQAASTAVTQK